MRVLFYYRGIESLGIEYLMASAKQHGHECELLFDPGLDDNLFLKLGFMKGFNQQQYMVEKALRFNPDIIAFSIPTNLYAHIKRAMALLKREIGVPIVAGGHHVNALPDYVLEDPNVDMICRGEGEEAFAELLDKMEQGRDIYDIQSFWFKKDGQIVRNELRHVLEDLDQLPFPEKEPFYNYGCFYDNLEMMTGRGCPFHCTFCSIDFQRRLMEGKGSFLRRRTVPNVIRELKHHLSRYDVRYVTFHDDNFTTSALWIEEFSEAYAREVGLPFYCFAYPTTVKPKVVKDLKHANCMQIFMGMDSGDASMRSAILKRRMSNERIIEAAALIKGAGISLQSSTIFGFPGEEPENMWRTLDLAVEMAPDQVSGYIFYPFPETELFEYAVQNGYLGPEEAEKVKRGEGGYHHDTILKHPHRKLAVTLAKMIPTYNKAPKWLRPLIRKLIAGQHMRLAAVIYVFTIPITFPFLGIEGIKVTLRMAWRAFRLRKKLVSELSRAYAPQQLASSG